MDMLVRKLIFDSYEEFSKDIVTFQETYGERRNFQELNKDLRMFLWDTLFSNLVNNTRSPVHYDCLSTLRLLSRDKADINELISDERIKIVLDYAALSNTDQEKISYTNVMIQSLKLLCNIICNSTKVQKILPTTSCLKCLIARMREYDDSVPSEIMLLDTKILFILTAMIVSTREIVKNQFNADECLIKMLEKTLKAEETILACDILKTLFNLYLELDDTTVTEERSRNLVTILYKFLIFKCPRDHDLQSNIANMLTVIPYNCYGPIIPPANSNSMRTYQNVDMTAVYILLTFLDDRLNCKEELIVNLCPIVMAFVRLVKAERLIRKYVRLQILPHLKNVMLRPEEGSTIRARLCKLLTSPLTELRDLVAEFLFILCKENVNRMVKYTGYGNAAGMFANKGLLGIFRKKPAYSSESEDSETEEYLKHKDKINPVTGCFEHPKPNPLEGMTEEQKEYEALQLVRLVDRLTREGLVQPCRIGDDGKPKPIEHVLELQEELPKQQYNYRDSDSD